MHGDRSRMSESERQLSPWIELRRLWIVIGCQRSAPSVGIGLIQVNLGDATGRPICQKYRQRRRPQSNVLTGVMDAHQI